jgi:hypothetical protein
METIQLSAYGIYIAGPGMRVINNDISGTAAQPDGSAYGLFVRAVGAVVKANRIDDVSTSGTGFTYGVLISISDDVLAIGNRITSADAGITYDTLSTGKYMGNLTSSVTTPFTGGTAVGTND